MRYGFQKYVPDHNGVTGFGGLLISSRMGHAMHHFARGIQLAIAAQAVASEAEAQNADIEPGHVTKTFSNTRRRGYIEHGVGWPGAIRRGVRIEATGTYRPGDRDEEGYAYNLRSDPIVLEAGSRRGYKEGARGHRPALRVMLKGARKWAAGTIGTQVKGGK